MTGIADVAFVRSPVAHARLSSVAVPDAMRGAVFTARDLCGVGPIVSAPPLPGFKFSVEPILAVDKQRYVGAHPRRDRHRPRGEARGDARMKPVAFDVVPQPTER